jgi:hypothetical protein
MSWSTSHPQGFRASPISLPRTSVSLSVQKGNWTSDGLFPLATGTVSEGATCWPQVQWHELGRVTCPGLGVEGMERFRTWA